MQAGISHQEEGASVYWTRGLDFPADSIYITLAVQVAQAVVQTITVHAEGYHNPEAFRALWATYAPEKVATTHGIASRVLVRAVANAHEGPPSPTMPYAIWLFYDDVGFYVQYGGTVMFAATYEVCPSFTFAEPTIRTLNMVLADSDSETPLEALDEFSAPGDFVKTLDEAAQIGPADLHEMLIDAERLPCFSTPRSIWP